MKTQRMFLVLLVSVISFATARQQIHAQTTPVGKTYQQMTPAERSAFVAEQAKRIGREMSGGEYEFTSDFVADIQQSVNQYAKRIGNNEGDRLGKGDVHFVFERGQAQAPVLMAAFKARSVSPLIGLYIPWIESEYVNIQTPNSVGALGMFQFLPRTGERFGLSSHDLLDVEKSADAAARYISDSLAQFSDDPMKEALALLAYNRGNQATARDVKALVNADNRRCSICALTADSNKLDPTFQNENVYYVPRFFAAAIIGENPQAFGLQMKSLSSN